MQAESGGVDRRARWAALRGELLRFALVGVLSYGLGIGLSALLHEAVRLPQQLAVGLALAIVLATNFFLARRFIFQSAGRLDTEAVRFIATSASMRAVEYLLFLAALETLGLNYLVSLTAAMALSNCVKFVLYRTVVFRTPRKSRALTAGAAAGPESAPPR